MVALIYIYTSILLLWQACMVEYHYVQLYNIYKASHIVTHDYDQNYYNMYNIIQVV